MMVLSSLEMSRDVCLDLNHDGLSDIVAASMHIQGPFDRPGRVTLCTSLNEQAK
jgi:hypothetical protein